MKQRKTSPRTYGTSHLTRASIALMPESKESGSSRRVPNIVSYAVQRDLSGVGRFWVPGFAMSKKGPLPAGKAYEGTAAEKRLLAEATAELQKKRAERGLPPLDLDTIPVRGFAH